MNEEDRWLIDELVTRYTLEPTLRDLYVEGHRDLIIFNWFIASREIRNAVYEIGCVNVPASAVLGLGLPDNNRGRLLTLAHQLELELGAIESVRLVVDQDFEHLFALAGRQTPKTNRALVWRTDFASLEMYLFRDDAVGKVFAVGCGLCGVRSDEFLRRIEQPLRWVFLFRAAIESLGLGVEVAFDGELDKKTMGLDCDAFVTNRLARYSITHRRTEVLREMECLRDKATGDRRHFMHGHDFLGTIAWFVRRNAKAFRSTRPEAVEAAVWTAWENEYVATQPLFVNLIAWASVSSGAVAP